MALRSRSSDHGRRCEKPSRSDEESRERNARNAGVATGVCNGAPVVGGWELIGSVGGEAIGGGYGLAAAARGIREFEAETREDCVRELGNWEREDFITYIYRTQGEGGNLLFSRDAKNNILSRATLKTMSFKPNASLRNTYVNFALASVTHRLLIFLNYS